MAKVIHQSVKSRRCVTPDPEPVKAAVVKENYLDTLRAIDPELVKTAVSGQRFQQCFFENCRDKEIEAFVRGIG